MVRFSSRELVYFRRSCVLSVEIKSNLVTLVKVHIREAEEERVSIRPMPMLSIGNERNVEMIVSTL